VEIEQGSPTLRASKKPVRSRKRYTFLAPFLDAEYGSAAFVPVNEPAELELRV